MADPNLTRRLRIILEIIRSGRPRRRNRTEPALHWRWAVAGLGLFAALLRYSCGQQQQPSAVEAEKQQPSAVEAEKQQPSAVEAEKQQPSAVEAEKQQPFTQPQLEERKEGPHASENP